MSTTAMWLLLAVVVILILFFSVLYKRRFTVHELALTGVMAALSLVAYLFFRIPFYGGSSFHLGNTFTALTAMLLDGVSGGLAGAIGLALADIVAGDPGYAITSFILKFIIGLVCGAVAHKVIHLKTFPTDNKVKYVAAVTASAFSGLLVNVFGKGGTALIQTVGEIRVIHKTGFINFFVVLIGKDDLVIFYFYFTDVFVINHAHEGTIIGFFYLMFH